MKKMLKINFIAYLFLIGLVSAQMSCSSTEKKEAATDSETAYNDFKTYVTSVETSTENAGDSASANWETYKSKSRAEYDAKVAQLDSYVNDYDESRRQEIDQLKTRYNDYWTKYDADMAAGNTVSESSANGGLTKDFNYETVSTTPATDIRKAYEDLVSQVQADKNNYKREDWKAVNYYYLSLDDRKNAVQSQLTANDKEEIAKAKTKYAAMRTAARFDIDWSEKPGQAKDLAKTGANKVENAAEKTGSAAKNTVNKIRDKVDQKVDDDPEKH